MIIQLRGTSGSGKSHIVRDIRAEMRNRTRHREEGRKQPIGYTGMYNGYMLGIPGHYETPCGGCDTIPDLKKVFQLVSNMAPYVGHVLFEGLLASEDVNKTLELDRQWPGDLRIVNIITPLEECLAGIQERRDNRGDTRELKPDNTANRVRRIERACERLKEAGVAVYTTDRDGAAALVKEWLK